MLVSRKTSVQGFFNFMGAVERPWEQTRKRFRSQSSPVGHVGVVYRNATQAQGLAVAEHDLVSEVYYILDGSATLVSG